MRDLVYDLVGHAAKVNCGDLPQDVIEITKKFILDTLGTAIAGSSAPGSGSVADLIKDWGGKEESTVMIYGGKVVAPHAAFINGMMAQALDLDDVHDEAVLHANATVLPSALAMAERTGNVHGKDLIKAVAVGNDVLCRIGLGVIGPLTWTLTSVTGYFGATIAAGKILGLDESKLRHAIGIAFAQCAGSAQSVLDGALVKRMHSGFGAKAGVLSAIFAEKDITGAKDIFEGRFGFFPLYFGGKYDRNKVTEGLGKTFEGKNLSIKLYIGGRYTHPCIDATLTIVEENNIGPDDVTEVVAHVTEASSVMVGKPFEIGESPQVEAQFSIPYGIALAIARRHVFIEDFFEEKIRGDTGVLQLAKKVKVIGDQGSIESIGRRMTPVVIEIKTKDEKIYSERVEVISGSPEKPASMEAVAEKFRKCAAFSAKPLPKGNIEEIIRLVKDLEAVPDVRSITGLTV